MSSVNESRPPSRGRALDPSEVFALNLLGGACLGYFAFGQKQKGVVALLLFLVLAPLTFCTASLIVSAIAAVDVRLQSEALNAGERVGQWTFFRKTLASGGR